MNTFVHNSSRIALIAVLSATPMALAAQDKPADDAAATQASDTASSSDKAASEKAGGSMDDAAKASDADNGKAAPAKDENAEGDSEMAPAMKEGSAAAAKEETGMAADNDNAAAEGAEKGAKPVEGQITMQSEDTVLGSNLMGAAVYSTDGDKVGDINNLIVNLDGTVDGVVIGVGGFLGIGEKSVAVKMDTLQVNADENGNTRLVTSSTKKDLKAAPDFVTKQQQKAEADAEAARQQAAQPATGAAGGTMGTTK